MTTFTKVPQAIEDVLEDRHATTSRRDFLKTSGALVVSFGAAGVTGQPSAAKKRPRPSRRAPILTPTSDSSIRGSRFMPTTPRPSTWGRRTVVKARERHFGR